jgi:hypothetical protein
MVGCLSRSRKMPADARARQAPTVKAAADPARSQTIPIKTLAGRAASPTAAW